MSRKFRFAYLAHTLRSDWNNGNAHFLRGLLRALGSLGHEVVAFEPADEWSLTNLRMEIRGQESLEQFARTYPELRLRAYDQREGADRAFWKEALRACDFVIVHEWNPAELAHRLLELREEAGYKLLFHDTHHRASSSPEAIRSFGTDQFDGILAFGESLRTLYREQFGLDRVWTLHEAADTRVFHPRKSFSIEQDVVWIGNWGDDERSAEIRQFLLKPARQRPELRFTIFGVRYPQEGLAALEAAGVRYGGYLPNLEAPVQYAASRLTVHVPRQQYTGAMEGIPTIRVFEALACGIPLVSAPWRDTEHLFEPGDFLWAHDTQSMTEAIEHLLSHPEQAAVQAEQGRQRVLRHHTCAHRAEQLTAICEELLH